MAFHGLVKYDDITIDGYPKIQYHGFIGNNRTAMLVAMNGFIDWGCLPNFNSPAVFSSILDKKKGGYFAIYPTDTHDLYVDQYYKELTNILVTEFIKNGKVILRTTDFMPDSEYGKISFPEVHRFVETFSDPVRITIDFKPAFNYATERPLIQRVQHGFIFSTEKENMGISTEFQLKKNADHVFADVDMEPRSSSWVIALYGIHHLYRPTDYKSYLRLQETTDYWRKWASNSTYSGMYHSMVMRSALALKVLFYEPTGMMVAAPTASLPEAIGGERNWDYRYTWIRDTAYVIEALATIGYKREAVSFLYDMMDVISRENKIRTIYSIDNSDDFVERELDFEGYRGSRPVRIGNKAVDQLQIDQYGSIVRAIHAMEKAGGVVNSYLWDFVEEMMAKIEYLWKYPDSSIWEFRTEPKQYVYSKVMSWAAFDSAITMARDLGLTAPIKKWKGIQDEIWNDVMTKGFDPQTNSFVQYYGSKNVDASLLRLPILGFIPANDERFIGTMKRIEDELMVDGYLFRRYREDDGLKGDEGSFLMLTFWYIEDLILMKRLKAARAALESIIEKANHLGLYSEEIDEKTGDFLGNFPQALSHLGIIRVAPKLEEAFLKRVSKINE
ncbi:glycoside hydrolase family 15 protein [Thermoplasma acidophilum]|nr:glycoside hydrolase family 15 protein [Thermoplasma acidophilum]BAR87974.1 trehalase [Thermoplasma acidophilum]